VIFLHHVDQGLLSRLVQAKCLLQGIAHAMLHAPPLYRSDHARVDSQDSAGLQTQLSINLELTSTQSAPLMIRSWGTFLVYKYIRYDTSQTQISKFHSLLPLQILIEFPSEITTRIVEPQFLVNRIQLLQILLLQFETPLQIA